jgi:TonB family protein
MAFRALLFSKNSETNTAMTAACKSTGIRVEVRSDIFTAIDQAKTRVFSCAIVDWADQPEATFLLKRAREAEPNRNTVSIAIVDHEPTAGEMRDNRLDFLIYRPISAEEAQAVLAKACEKMQPSVEDDAEAELDASDRSNGSASSLSDDANGPNGDHAEEPVDFAEENTSDIDANNIDESTANFGAEEEARKRGTAIGRRGAYAAALVLVVALGFWKSHEVLGLLSQTPLKFRGLRDSISALFTHPAANPTVTPTTTIDAQQDAYLNKDQNSNGQIPALGVVATTSTLSDAPQPLPPASDLPLPVPAFERPKEIPVHVQRAAIPDSMKNSPPIAPPVVVAVNPAQLMPVSIPQSQPAVQPTGERVTLNEEAARALLVRTVNAVYPQEAMAQKLHGPVVLQLLIARDGSVEDLKIVRGYFILGRAAVAAVKQWQFQPYTVNGHATPTQTVITVNFSYPPK